MNLETAISKASQILKEKNIKTAKLDSELLMSKAINKDKKFVILNLRKNIEKGSFKYFEHLIEQRSKGKPVAYLVGKKSFWKNEFEITKDVLVPRPDTELIIEEVLKISKFKNKLHILDIGIGSGCVLLSILDERKDFLGVGIDISKKCLDLCKINTIKLGLKNRVKLFKSNVDNFNYGKYDLIISNPPYIKKLDLKYLERDIFGFEPINSLNGGIDGLSEIRKVITKSSELIKKNGKFILEIGFNQKDKVIKLLMKNGFYINKVSKDLAKNDRCIVSTKI